MTYKMGFISNIFLYRNRNIFFNYRIHITYSSIQMNVRNFRNKLRIGLRLLLFTLREGLRRRCPFSINNLCIRATGVVYCT